MNIKQIKSLLKEITPWKLSEQIEEVNRTSSFSQILIVDEKSKKGLYGHLTHRICEMDMSHSNYFNNAKFIAASPEIVRFLLDRVDDRDHDAKFNRNTYFEMAKKIKDLELRLLAARHVAALLLVSRKVT